MKLLVSLVVFTAMVTFAEAMLRNCKTLECPANKTVKSSAAYTLSTTNTYYEPRKAVTVIVSTKQCPQKKRQPGPQWYRLEVINSTGYPVTGRFAKPSQRSEDRACEQNSLIIFHTCEPMVMHDLPRKYVFRMQQDIGDICFRITIHRKGDGYCEEIKHCIKSISTLSTKNVTVTANITNTTANTTNATMTTSNSTFQNGTTHNNTSDLEVSSGMTSEITPTSEPTKKSTEKRSTDIIDILIGKRRRRRSRRCRACSQVNSAAEKVCGTDSNTYASECHLKRQACLTKTNIGLYYYGPCRENPPTYCELGWGRVPGTDWYSGCNCFGYYKPRQCLRDSVTGKYECWCSDEQGYKISGTGKSFSCEEKITEVMNCF